MKILIIKLKTIGDVLLTTPLISNLRSYYPNSTIDVMINKGTEDMLNCNPKVDGLLIYDREKIRSMSGLKKAYSEYKFLTKVRKNRYDIVIDLDYGDRDALITKFSGAKIRVGSHGVKNKIVANTYTHFLPRVQKGHIVERNLDPLSVLKIPINNKKVEIFWHKSDKSRVKSLFCEDKFVHIHPFSRVENKELNISTLAGIIDFFEIDLDLRVVITAAPIDRELAKVDEILHKCKSNPINLGGQLTLRQTAFLNSRSTMFVGVDTAVMHMSAANSTPTLVFFGPSSPDVWGPWGNGMDELNFHRSNGIQQHLKNIVFSDRMLCIPCNSEKCHNKSLSDCLSSLNMSDIKQSILELLK